MAWSSRPAALGRGCAAGRPGWALNGQARTLEEVPKTPPPDCRPRQRGRRGALAARHRALPPRRQPPHDANAPARRRRRHTALLSGRSAPSPTRLHRRASHDPSRRRGAPGARSHPGRSGWSPKALRHGGRRSTWTGPEQSRRASGFCVDCGSNHGTGTPRPPAPLSAPAAGRGPGRPTVTQPHAPRMGFALRRQITFA